MGAGIKQGRWAADIEGDFVVFVIGTRPDWRHPIRWFRDVGGMRGMPHMLSRLADDPESGFLGCVNLGLTNIQYWRSFEHLERWSGDRAKPHRPAWQKYWKRVGRDARSGIWHETFLVRAGEYEAIYANMPPYGLGRATSLVPLNEQSTSRGRLKHRTSSDTIAHS